jgi:hypothetical protein
LYLGSFGLSTQAISEATGLSPGQVLYRLKKGHVLRRDYRNGKSRFALNVKAGLKRVTADRIKLAPPQKRGMLAAARVVGKNVLRLKHQL